MYDLLLLCENWSWIVLLFDSVFPGKISFLLLPFFTEIDAEKLRTVLVSIYF